MKTIRFESQEHENFFYSMLKRTGNTDSYHQAVFLLRGDFRHYQKKCGADF